MTLSYFVHLYMQWEGLLDYLTLYVSLLTLQDGVTALAFASKNDHINVVKLLLQSGALVNKVQHCM